MKTRATITIEPALLAQTRIMAQKKKTNVSNLIAQLLTHELQKTSNVTDQLIGSASLKSDDQDPRYTYLAKKYLRG